MVVGAIHGRTDQIYGARINTDIVLVDLLFVDSLGDQAAVGPHHKATHLGADGHIAHTGGNKDFVVGRVHPLADGVNVVGLLLG